MCPVITQTLPMVFALCIVFVGCGETIPEKPLNVGKAEVTEHPENAEPVPGEAKKLKVNNAQTDEWLTEADFEEFRTGMMLTEIQKKIGRTGISVECGTIDGHVVEAVAFGLFQDKMPTFTWAIFEDDEFKKFVEFPNSDGTRPKIGEHPRLERAYKSKAVSYVELKQQTLETIENAPKPQIDLGLTAAWLVLNRAVKEGEKRQQPTIQKNLEKNAVLLKQFDAARLDIGMTKDEVLRAMDAQPIETGAIDAGTYEIYGSTEDLDLGEHHEDHYANILTVFKHGRLTGYYVLEGGTLGIKFAHQNFADLTPIKF